MKTTVRIYIYYLQCRCLNIPALDTVNTPQPEDASQKQHLRLRRNSKDAILAAYRGLLKATKTSAPTWCHLNVTTRYGHRICPWTRTATRHRTLTTRRCTYRVVRIHGQRWPTVSTGTEMRHRRLRRRLAVWPMLFSSSKRRFSFPYSGCCSRYSDSCIWLQNPLRYI